MLWAVNIFALTLACLLLLSGALSDHFGRRKIFSIGIGLFTAASLLCAGSSDIVSLIVSRGIQGIGAAFMIPGSLAIINIAIPEERRGRAIDLWSGFLGGIAAMWPFFGGWLVQYFSWRAAFLINVPLGALALFLTFYAIPESKNDTAKRYDWKGAFLIGLSARPLIRAYERAAARLGACRGSRKHCRGSDTPRRFLVGGEKDLECFSPDADIQIATYFWRKPCDPIFILCVEQRDIFRGP
jgi:MFS family permease